MPLIKSDNIYLGDTSVKKMYLNGALIFQNFTFIKVTAITLGNLIWTTNIPASGGTATKDNCTYSVTAYYSDGTTSDVTSKATITGSQEIPSTNIGEVHSAGTLTLTASYCGFTATGTVTVYQDAAVPDFSTKPLTFNILSAGTIKWVGNFALVLKTIEYKLNDDEWTSITATYAGVKITVNSGDKLQFRGNNAQYGMPSSLTSLRYSSFEGSTAVFEVEGNIMSLINSTNFATLTTLESGYTFSSLFINCTGLTSAENLVLPATTLTAKCYQYMFKGCTSLTTAPALPVNILVDSCYYNMFNNCTSLNYIKCLATDISASYCTSDWVNNVASTGTFVKNPNMNNWITGVNGIPTGWTIIDA